MPGSQTCRASGQQLISSGGGAVRQDLASQDRYPGLSHLHSGSEGSLHRGGDPEYQEHGWDAARKSLQRLLVLQEVCSARRRPGSGDCRPCQVPCAGPCPGRRAYRDEGESPERNPLHAAEEGARGRAESMGRGCQGGVDTRVELGADRPPARHAVLVLRFHAYHLYRT